MQRTRGLEVVQRVAHFAAGGLHEVGDVDVSDAGLEQEGEIDGVAWDLVAHEIEAERAVVALALHDDQDVGSPGALEHGCDGSGVEAFGGFTVDRKDQVSGADSGFVGGRSLERGEHDDVGHSSLIQLGLDGHANAVVLAMLLLAHLGEGLGVVKVGVRVEGVQHAGDGAVVDGLVDFVLVQGLCVVLLDQAVDVGELVQGVAQGGLVGCGLCGDLVADEGAGEGAACQKEGDGEESAAGAWGHRLGNLEVEREEMREAGLPRKNSSPA